MNPTEPTEPVRPSTPCPAKSDPVRPATPRNFGPIAPQVVSLAGPASASNIGLPVKCWKPPARTNPTQTFAQFKRKVESEWRGSILQAKSGDIIITIPKRDLLLSELLDEMSNTDGKGKEMRVFDNNGKYTCMVYDAILRNLMGERAMEEERQSFWLPRSVFIGLYNRPSKATCMTL